MKAGIRAGLAEYGRLLEAVGEASHQSCLVLTSREAPPELGIIGGTAAAVRSIHVSGLAIDEAQQLLAANELAGSREEWAELIARCGGNGPALQVVGASIRELFGGQIGRLPGADARRAVFSAAFDDCWPISPSAAPPSNSSSCTCLRSSATLFD